MQHTAIDTRTVLALAAEADVDPRSVRRELAALAGRGAHVRGRSGERIRAALVARGLLANGGAGGEDHAA